MIIKDLKVVSFDMRYRVICNIFFKKSRSIDKICLFSAVATTTISSEVAYAISGSRLYSFSPEPAKNKSSLSSENTRHLLSCFAWIVKNLDKGVLHK